MRHLHCRALVVLCMGLFTLGCGGSETKQAARPPEQDAAPQPEPSTTPEPTPADSPPEAQSTPLPDAEPEAPPEVAENGDAAEVPQPVEVTEETPTAPAVVRRVLLFAKGGPLVVDVQLTIDGLDTERGMEELIDAVLAAADTDGDGQPTWQEAVSSPRLAFDEFAGSANDRQERIRMYDRDGDDVLDRLEAWTLASQGSAAGIVFRLNRTQAMGAMASPQAEVQHLIDVDYNGQLTAEEIAEAPARLKLGDMDDDDLLEPGELQTPSMAAEQADPRRDVSRLPMPAVLIDAQTTWGVVYYELKDRYHYGGPFDAGNFPLVPRLVEAVDADGNGEFDRGEVERLAEIEPHLLLEAEFGVADGDNAARLRIARVDPQLGLGEDALIETAAGVRVELTGMTLDFTAYDASGANSYTDTARQRLEALDADKNGYLEPAEAADVDADEFALWDADGDGRVFLEELTDALRSQQAPLLNRISAEVAESRQSLFTALDVSRDGRLSAREMQQAVERFTELDQDGDRRLAPREMPGRLSLTFSRGQGGAPQLASAMEMVGDTQVASAPPWFTGMDSNADADVSRREFLGPADLFDRLDSDGDGLISVAEADEGEADDRR